MPWFRVAIGFLRQLFALFVIGVALNYVWEIAQAPLYAGMDWKNVWFHCFIASLGDGVLIGIIFVVGWATFRNVEWYRNPSGGTITLTMVTGMVIGIGIEWIALHYLQRWAYADRMPLLPLTSVGLVPVLQMTILPPIVFYAAGRWLWGKELPGSVARLQDKADFSRLN